MPLMDNTMSLCPLGGITTPENSAGGVFPNKVKFSALVNSEEEPLYLYLKSTGAANVTYVFTFDSDDVLGFAVHSNLLNKGVYAAIPKMPDNGEGELSWTVLDGTSAAINLYAAFTTGKQHTFHDDTI